MTEDDAPSSGPAIEREHVVIGVLILALLLVGVAVIVGARRDDSDFEVDRSESSRPAFGRLADRSEAEFSSQCGNPSGISLTFPTSCDISISSTDVPFVDVPLLRILSPRELRRVDLTVESCTAEIHVRSGQFDYKIRIGSDDDEVRTTSISIDPEGATLDFDVNLISDACSLVMFSR